MNNHCTPWPIHVLTAFHYDMTMLQSCRQAHEDHFVLLSASIQHVEDFIPDTDVHSASYILIRPTTAPVRYFLESVLQRFALSISGSGATSNSE